MLWALVVLLLLLWIGGFTLNVAGGLIHLLLVLAVIVVIYNLFSRSIAGYRALPKLASALRARDARIDRERAVENRKRAA